ncbi:rhodanese-like domain-containing protein [Fulvimonas soli]|uniref:Rhodanese-related sulfurtransferase n=1 Tax=Fulvimonas soli TaxID=155197 RepID=A0A316I0K5_9GAMM|nr:rhodanese-like domain-containing protein [Fulvimonas soli]PWK85802.1 rhodanese-related sulfurtransferase [Fulvimonas soli]
MTTKPSTGRCARALRTLFLLLPALSGVHAGDAPLGPAQWRARQARPDAPLLLDVRHADEYRDGHIAGALNIPLEQLAARHGALGVPRGGEIVVYCVSGRRAGKARELLESLGYTHVRLLDGSLEAWRAQHLPLVREGGEPSHR